MRQAWLNFLLHFSGVMNRWRQKLAGAYGFEAVGLGLGILFLELVNLVISLPAYFLISPAVLPSGKGVDVDTDAVKSFRLRRVVSLSVLASVVGIWILKIGLGALVTFGIFSHGAGAKADTVSWDFNNPVAYVYDPTKIEIVDGMAILKANPLAVGTSGGIEPSLSLPPADTTVSASADTTVSTDGTGVSPSLDVSTGAPPVETDPLPAVEDTTASTIVPTPEPPVQLIEPTPLPSPEPIVEPAPAPLPEPTPLPPPPSGLLRLFEPLFGTPAHAQTTSCSATLQPLIPLTPLNVQQWTGFTDAVNANGGSVAYQLSTDAGLTWQFWDGTAWTTAGDTDFNDNITINVHITDLPNTVLGVVFRARLTSDCSADVQLLGISLTYDHTPPASVDVQTQTYTLTALPGVTFTDAYGSQISATTGSAYITVGGQRVAYVELTGDLDLTTSLALGGATAALVTLNPLSHQHVDTFQLMVPKVLGQTQVQLCPGVSALDAILPTCPDSVSLSAINPSAGAYALVKLDAPDYWYIEVNTAGLIALGAAQLETPAVPSVETPTVGETCSVLFSGDSLSGAAAALAGVADYSFTTEMTLTESGDSGLVIRSQDDANYWQLLFHGGTAQFTGAVNGALVPAGSANLAAFAPELNTTYLVKVQVNGTHLRAKWWAQGEVEPAAWLAYAEDNRIETGGIGLVDSAGALFQNLSVSTCLEDDTVSLQETVIQNLLNANHAPQILTVSGSQQLDDGFVDPTYTLSDAENNFVHLAAYEYSLTGNFSGEEVAMTVALADADHDGVTTLSSTSNGVAHTFVWDAAADVGEYAGLVYVRLKPADSLEAGEFTASNAITLDLKPPVISAIIPLQLAGTDTVRISYHLANEPTSDVAVRLELSVDAGLTWSTPENLDGDVGTLADVQAANQTITWDAGADYLNQDQLDVQVRLVATDAFLNAGVGTSASFSVDTRPPFGLAGLHGQASNQDSILWAWSPVAVETNFSGYEIWYGTNQDEVEAHGSGAVHITKTGNPNLGIMGTDSLLTVGLQADTQYFAQVTATDGFGHSVSLPVAAFATAAAGAPATFPDSAAVPPVVPSGGFHLSINSGAATTSNSEISLGFNAGSDVATMAISNFADLHDALQQPYASTTAWDVCQENGELVSDCQAGSHRVYARLYTETGISSNAISDLIELVAPSSVPASGEAQVSADIEIGPGAGANAGSSVRVGGAIGGGGGGSGTAEGGAVGAGFGTQAGGTPGAQSRSQQGAGVPNSAGGQSQGAVGTGQPAPGIQAGGGVQPGVSAGAGAGSADQSTVRSVVAVQPKILTDLSRAKESPILAAPTVGRIRQPATANTVELSGTAVPNASVILFLHSDQVVVYSTKADSAGAWAYVHSQDEVNLAPGTHTLFALTYDEGSRVKSKPSIVKKFEVKKNPLAEARSYFHLSTTLLTLLVALVAVFSLRKFGRRAQPLQ